MNTGALTAVILTYNEAPNLRRTLERLRWVPHILVVDSFSTDETLAIAATLPQVRVAQRQFDNHTAQWNFGLDQADSKWVLSLDADYLLSDELVNELRALSPPDSVDAYAAPFRYHINGVALHANLLPPRAILFRRTRCRYVADGHTQLLKVEGETLQLRGWIYHDDRKPLSRWVWAQDRYASLEAQKLLDLPLTQLSVADRTRRSMVFGPVLVFFYTLLARALVLNGWRGFFYVLQRTLAEILLALRLLERRLGGGEGSGK